VERVMKQKNLTSDDAKKNRKYGEKRLITSNRCIARKLL
jgi:hypothetical protein